MNRAVGISVVAAVVLAAAVMLWFARDALRPIPSIARAPADAEAERVADGDRTDEAARLVLPAGSDREPIVESPPIDAPKPATYRLRGRVLGLGEAPAKRPRLSIQGIPCVPSLVFHRSATVDDAGAFDADLSSLFAENTALARLDVSVDDPEFLPASASVDVLGSANPNGPWWVEIALTRVTSVAGRVVDRAGVPIPSIVVHAWPTAGDVPQPDGVSSAWTEADGRFEMRVAQSGTHLLTAGGWKRRSASEPVTLDPGSRADAPDLVLDDGYSITGRVLGSDGVTLVRPRRVIADLEVSQRRIDVDRDLTLVDGRPVQTHAEATVDAEGRFELVGLDPAPYRIRLEGIIAFDPSDASQRDLEVIEWRVSAPASDLDLVLPLLARIVVEVRDAEGRVPGALVRLECDNGRVTSRRADATASFGALPEATYRIRVTHDRYEEALSEVIAPAAGEARTVAVILKSLRNQPALVVTLVGPDNRIVTDAQFDLFEADSACSFWQRRTVARDGRFWLGGIRPGRYRLAIDPRDGADDRRCLCVSPVEDVDLTADDPEVALTLHAVMGGRLRFVAHETHGRSIRARWRLLEPGGRDVLGFSVRRAAEPTEGDVSDRALPPGTYTVEGSAPGYASRSIQTRVVAGETTTVDLTLERD